MIFKSSKTRRLKKRNISNEEKSIESNDGGSHFFGGSWPQTRRNYPQITPRSSSLRGGHFYPNQRKKKKIK